MIQLAKTTMTTKASPEAIFSLWSDIDNWSLFDPGIEWAKLTNEFTPGGRYAIKPKGGPVVHSTIRIVEKPNRFIDDSHLFGATLTFDHTVAVQANGKTTVNVVMTMSGPLSWVWSKILGKNQQRDLEISTSQLIAKAEKIA